MKNRYFVDTAILLYAYDIDAGDKHKRCAEVVKWLWDTGAAVISTQILQEFYVSLSRKLYGEMLVQKAWVLLGDYSAWHVETITAQTIQSAANIQSRHKISFRDALVIASAIQSDISNLLSEDINKGQDIAGITVLNPFRESAEIIMG